MGLGNAYQNATLDAILGSSHHSGFPNTIYLAFFRDDAPPSDAGGGTEIGVARLSIANDDAHWGPASGSQKSNATDLTTAAAPTDEPQAGWYALMSAGVAGNVVVWGQLIEPVTVRAGESISIPTGGLVVTAT